MTQDEIIEMAMEAEFVSRGKPSEEESELFVCVDKDIVRFYNLVAAKALAQRTWVGLTDDEIAQAIESINMLHGDYATEVAYAIEDKLKQKNS